MRKCREIIRLADAVPPLSQREIARSCDLSPSSVAKVLKQASATGMTWAVAQALSEAELDQRLSQNAPAAAQWPVPSPDWEALHKQLRQKGMTRKLLWQDYRELHPDGYGYSQFCYHLGEHCKRLDPVMRQEHKAGEKLFVDWAGLTIPYEADGQARQAHIFVATLGASNYTFAQVYADETLSNWVDAHVECFEYLGGVPQLLVPDNCKTGVTRANYYDPDLNPTYQELAEHYGVGVLPARSRRPQDKSKVETAVQIVEREIIVLLRRQCWHSLGELREVFAQKLNALNERPFSQLPGCRASAFTELDQPLLRPLPGRRYSYGRWSQAKVANDYHVQLDKHYYSVPHRFIGEQVQLRTGGQLVEIFHRGERIASHTYSTLPGKATTEPSHRPPRHDTVISRSSERYLGQARQIGPCTETVINHILAAFPHPEMGFRSCEGLLRLAQQHGPDRLEAASARAYELGSCTYRHINNLLRNHREDEISQLDAPPPIANPNIRGSHYYAHKGN